MPSVMERVALVAVTPKLSPMSDRRNTTHSVALAPMSAVEWRRAYMAMRFITLRRVEAALLVSLCAAIGAALKAIAFIAW